MARKPIVDVCFLCGCAPCECNGKPKKAKSGKVRPVVDVELPPPPKPSFLDAMKEAAEQAAREPKRHTYHSPPPTAPKPVEVPQWSDEELLFNDAIRNLEPILAADERQRYSGIITSKPGPEERKALWQARRRAAQADGEGLS